MAARVLDTEESLPIQAPVAPATSRDAAQLARPEELALRPAVDTLYDQVYRELLTYMMGDPRTINRATHLLWAAHNLERVADRVTNICERVVFSVTGSLEEIKSTY